MITNSPLFAIGIKVISLTAIAAILFTTNVAVAGPTTTFQSTYDDSFRVQIPEGWIIQDVNNSGSALEAEALEGVGLLAQLCPAEEARAQSLTSPNVGGGNDSTNSTGSLCQGAQEVIHIIRYPNVDTGTQQPGDEEAEEEDDNGTNNNNLTTYHLQKLEEVGYNNIQTINSATTTVNLILPQTNETVAEMPARIVEMTYSTASAPDEIRRGYFILTATASTLPNFETPKGYSVLYAGNPVASSSPLSPVIAQIFDSFELIAAPEAGR